MKAAQAELTRHRERMKERSQEINSMAEKLQQLQKESGAIDLELAELDHKITKSAKEAKDAAKLVICCLFPVVWWICVIYLQFVTNNSVVDIIL